MKDKKYINVKEFFDNCLENSTLAYEQVGWKNAKSQTLRFSILSEIANLDKCSILDVGCGMGGFYKYLNLRYKIKDYLGIDINEKMILNAKKNIPGIRFEVKDLLKDPINETYDYVFESGIFNLFIENWKKVVYSTLIKMFSLCNMGMGINFLSSLNIFKKNNKCYYVYPMEMCKFIIDNLSKKFIMRHDYKFNDVSFFVYKD